jgi:hypothetical protein
MLMTKYNTCTCYNTGHRLPNQIPLAKAETVPPYLKCKPEVSNGSSELLTRQHRKDFAEDNEVVYWNGAAKEGNDCLRDELRRIFMTIYTSPSVRGGDGEIRG